MTEMQETDFPSPFATLWLSPRQTIQRIVGRRPTYLVLPLAALGTVSGFYMQLVSVGLAAPWDDWRLSVLALVIAALCGIIWLYPSALILSWIGLLLGGEATARQMRAVLAWSTVPVILGSAVTLAVVLVVKAAGGGSLIPDKALPWLGACFSVWTTIVFILMLGRIEQFGLLRTIIAYIVNNLVFALFAALLVRTFLYQPFNIPAASMMPTLMVGDYVFVSKFAYGYSRFSFPFSPLLFSGRVFGREPRRGDVVVFRLPRDQRTDYLKRVIGMPGDRIQMKDGVLTINDAPVTREPIADFVGDACGTDATAPVRRWRETLPNGASYETLDCIQNGYLDNTNVFTVPAGHYFVLGDNRDNSTDSRVPSVMGSIPLENLIGRVDLIFYSRISGSGEVRSDRIGTVVR
jgi:signal peptidase I